MTAQRRVLLVGAGNMGTNHARVISQSDRATLVGIVDPRDDVGNSIAGRFNTQWYPELPDLTNIDAVVVAAATEAHFDLSMTVLAQETALLVEKPVADSLLRTSEVLAEADRRDLPFMCGLLERFNPAVLTAMTLITDPFHVTATRHSPYTPRIKTGVAWDLLVHDVDLAIMILGSNPIKVNSKLGFFHKESNPEAEDVAETLLEFENGAVAHVSASRVGQRKIRQLSVYESEKLVEVDLLRRDVTVYRHVAESADDEGRGYRQQTVIEIPELITSQEPLTTQFTRFLDIIDGKVDAATERSSIFPSHSVIDQVIAGRSNG
ncbi:Gfo/Idh/MocA family protein [Lacisediminihabitans profunda]|uniref:Gfo/Idh/MocA family oxidoreductase n=1 Tax=Lacisediminihabitans profunda TaxID=2594790 RepID=A0A5C8ULT9_9MICO|nr:Gfo/Idh/MocA family oxidoreductase [Lacisediminihabitans profunda]TXN28240.1 Gfo/Idh/MocA family oxidoreductase [Lacisediminihabitans profunda]